MQQTPQENFSFKNLFVPLTTYKAVFFIIVIGLCVYFNSLFNGFAWDDFENIINNTVIHSISNIDQFFTGSTFNSGGAGGLVGLYYKPLITTTFSLIYTLFGENPFFYHLLQVLIHIANTILIFIFLKHLLKKHVAFILSIVFLVHPMNVEAVSYISALEDVLFFFFGMLALVLVQNNALKSKTKYFVSLLLLLAVLSKESSFLFVIVIFLYIFLFRKKELIKYVYVTLPVIGIYSILRFAVAQIYLSSPPVFAMTRLPFWERMKSLPEMIFYYIKNCFYPKDLAIAQDWTVTQITIQNFYQPLVFVTLFFTGLAGFGYYLWKSNNEQFKIFLFFFSFFLLSLGIHLQILPLDLTVAERWFYMPMVGLLGIIGLLLQRVSISKTKLKLLLVFTAVVVIILLSIRTVIRNMDWKSEATLYKHDIQVNTNSYQLETNYGLVLLREGKVSEGREHLIKSTQLAPYRWSSWTSIGASYELEKDYVNARKYYEIAMSKGPYYRAYQNYAKLLLYHGTPQEAQSFTKKAVSIFPANADLWLILALAEYNLGNKKAALEASHQSYVSSPNNENYHIYSRLLQNLPIEKQELH